MNIAIDTDGGDYAPGEMIKGALMALECFPSIEFTLLGKSHLIREFTDRHPCSERINVVDTPEEISMVETPSIAVKNKKNSALVVGSTLLKEKKCDALISAGNTGAILAATLLYTGRIKGVLRPALSPMIPTRKGMVMIIDGGANVDCKPSFLEQFAIMGSIFMDKVVGRNTPSIGLLNIGSEKEKGNELTKESYERLRNREGINFGGNVEGREIMNGVVDVVVCDGFSGNVLLKTVEGVGSFMSYRFSQVFRGLSGKVAGLLVMRKIDKLRKEMNYEEYGGSPLLGIDGVVIKIHGASKAKTVLHAIKQAVSAVENGIIDSIKEQVQTVLRDKGQES